MGSVPKRHCQRDEKTLDAEKDYISNLPDCLLSLILSKLPTKYAVGTSILSTRWKHLFALIPSHHLELDDSLILHPQNQDSEDENRGRLKRASMFAKFMDRIFNVILKEVPFITEFKLKLTEKYPDKQIIVWVGGALSRAVRNLDIDIPLGNSEWFFKLISNWSFIFFLALRNKISIRLPNSISFPNLHQLVLDKINILDGNMAVSLLLSACPLLHCLTMQGLIFDTIDIDDEVSIQISVPKLKNLTIKNCWYNGSVRYFRLVLDTPALQYLYYKDYMPDELVFNNVNSIESAHLRVKKSVELDEPETLEYNKDVAAFVRSCSNAELLFLSKYTVSALQESNEEVPIFCNLISLQLGGLNSNGWALLPRLLANASKLDLFSILKDFNVERGFEIFMSQLSKVTPFTLSNLKEVEILNLQGEEEELALIQYFLEFGKALNFFTVVCDMCIETYDFVEETLENMHISSDTCQMTYSIAL